MRLRDAQPADAAGIARVHVDSWRTTYAGLVPDQHLAGLTYERFEQNWLRNLANPGPQSFYLVAETPDGRIAGFAAGGPEREGRTDYLGEIYALYLLQAHQRQGHGRALVALAASRLIQQGTPSLLIWVLSDNPNRAFYAALGGVPVVIKPVEIGGISLIETAYGWPDLRPLLNHPPSA